MSSANQVDISRIGVRKVNEHCEQIGRKVYLKRECVPRNAKGIFGKWFLNEHGFREDQFKPNSKRTSEVRINLFPMASYPQWQKS